MKKIIVTMIAMSSALAVSSFTQQARASNDLCLASTNDCTFVLLSTKVSKQTSELVSEIAIEAVATASDTNDSTQENSNEIAIENAQLRQSASLTEKSEMLLVVNEARAKQRLSPFSTFKIANSLIALESQQVTTAEQVLTFDKEKYPVQGWLPSVWKLPEYNLASAFKFSMVAIFRQIASDIGQETMDAYLTSFDYGNSDTSSGLDDFWLNGSLQISALEQVRFLQKMHQGQLPLSKHSIDTLEEVMLVETTDSYSLYAKTGAGKANSQDQKLGWYVGFVENIDGIHYFAFNVTRDSYAQIKAVQVEIARNHLKKAGII